MTSIPTLEFFQLSAAPVPFVPATYERDWMEMTRDHYAYRCIPLAIANASGWELRCPFAFEAAWNGSDGLDAIEITTTAKHDQVSQLIASHFGHGILTFYTGWLVRTSPGWATWVRGAPNLPKDGIMPLDGLVETDWLPFPFTMNWRFLRPGRISFERDEPFCFITPVAHAVLDGVQPVVRQLSEDPQLAADYEGWRVSRNDFNARLQRGEDEAVRQRWQRGYVHGKEAKQSNMFHVVKRRLKAPE